MCIINTAKTKVMVAARANVVASIIVNGQSLEQVSSFVYLGATFKEDGSCSPEIRKRLAMGRSVMQSLSKMWKSKQVTRSTKVRLVRALVWSVATYGSEGLDGSFTRHKRNRLKLFWDVVLPKSIESFVDRSQNKWMGTIKARSGQVTVSSHKKIEAELLWTYSYNEESKLFREGHHTGLRSREQR